MPLNAAMQFVTVRSRHCRFNRSAHRKCGIAASMREGLRHCRAYMLRHCRTNPEAPTFNYQTCCIARKPHFDEQYSLLVRISVQWAKQPRQAARMTRKKRRELQTCTAVQCMSFKIALQSAVTSLRAVITATLKPICNVDWSLHPCALTRPRQGLACTHHLILACVPCCLNLPVPFDKCFVLNLVGVHVLNVKHRFDLNRGDPTTFFCRRLVGLALPPCWPCCRSPWCHAATIRLA